MIKNFTKLTGLFLLISCLNVFGQVSSYTFTQFGGTFNSISSTGTKAVGVPALIDDEVRSNFPIGFNFTFNGANYSNFGLNANGWIALGTVTPVNSTTPISGGTTNNIISGFGRDLQGANSAPNSTLALGSNTIITTNPSFFAVGDSVFASASFPATGGVVTAVSGNSVVTNVNATGSSTTASFRRKGYIYYQTIGAVPNRTLVVEWNRFSRFGTTAVENMSFQIRLNETSNLVEVIYGVFTTTTTTNNTCQIGLRGNTNADFNNRVVATTGSWAASTPGPINSSLSNFSSTLTPVSGQVYQWDPNIQPTDGGVTAMVTPVIGGCYGTAENIVVTLNNYGSLNLTNIPVTVVVSGAATQTSNATYTGVLTPMTSVNFTVATLNMSAAGVYSFNATTSISGDGNALNDAMAQVTRTVVAASPIPQAVNFTGYTGANLPTPFPLWSEATGSVVPAGTTSAWTSQTGLNGVGNITARINLVAASRNEWIVGPKISATANTQLTFDAAITGLGALTSYSAMGSDDKVRVMVSTDCGVSFAPVFTVSATNSLTTSFTNFSVPLGAYAGQNIIVAFLAQDGPTDDLETYDFHLDNINLLNASSSDAGVSAMVSPITSGCYSASENVVVTIDNYGTSSITNVPVTVVVSGAVSQTINATYTGTIAPAASANFTVGTLNMTTAGVYTFNATTSLSGDGNAFNDAMPQTIRTVVATVTLPQAVSFTGYTGANLPTPFPLWTEATGSIVPTGTTSAWTSQTGLNGVGNITARLNLLAVSRNEWIVGPKFTATSSSQLTFDAAITGVGALTTYSAMGSDDMVRVMVSTDCGATYVPVFTVSATNSLTSAFTNFVVSLSAYAGQNITVGFLAQDGPVNDVESYDFHLDNINLYNPVANDAGVSALVSPVTTGCYGTSENVVVTINNYGSNAISNIPVTVTVSGAVSQTINATYTGTIAPTASANFTVGTLNMTTAGTYSFDASSALVGDGNAANDMMVQTTRTNIAPVSTPQSVSFTGYTGANLPTAFPNWREGLGAVPGGTTSAWTSQTGLNGVGNITARINLFTTTRNEWIVGPKITASASTQLTFDAAITDFASLATYSVMGSDDMVRVMVSTDCGVSYAPVFTVSATNSLTTTFTNFTVSLGAYAGQNIIVAFLATDGPVNDPEDYDFHLDNINLCTTPSAPAAPLASAICTGTTTTINSTTVTGTPYWYNVPTGGSVISTSTVFTTPTLTANATYYLADSTGCGIGPRTAVTITVSPIPSVSVATTNSILCTGNTATLTASGATTYSWSGVGAGATVTVSPTANTVYTVTGTNPGCSASTAFTQSVSTCTGIENVLSDNNGVMLYPNPTSGNIHLKVSSVSESTQLEIYDALGKIVLLKKINAYETTIDISELGSGIYIFRVNTSNGILKQGKLVKE